MLWEGKFLLATAFLCMPGCPLSRTKVGRACHCSLPYNGECESVCGPLPSPPNTSGRRRAKERGKLLLCAYVSSVTLIYVDV